MTPEQIRANTDAALNEMELRRPVLSVRAAQELVSKLKQYDALVRETRDALLESTTIYDDDRCQMCAWPFSDKGCTPNSCSYRPREGSAEWSAYKKRRSKLELLARADELLKEPR